MTTPSVSDILHDGRPRTKTDWSTMLNRFLDWITDGNYDLTVNSLTATTYNNLPGFDITNLTTGEAITKGNIVRLKASDGKVWKADEGSLLGVTNVLGVASNGYASGEIITINKDSYTEFAGLTVGAPYYVGASGAISATAGTYYYKIGTATATTTLIIDIGDRLWAQNNYGYGLLPLDSDGTSNDDTLDLGSSSKRWSTIYGYSGNFSTKVTVNLMEGSWLTRNNGRQNSPVTNTWYTIHTTDPTKNFIATLNVTNQGSALGDVEGAIFAIKYDGNFPVNVTSKQTSIGGGSAIEAQFTGNTIQIRTTASAGNLYWSVELTGLGTRP